MGPLGETCNAARFKFATDLSVCDPKQNLEVLDNALRAEKGNQHTSLKQIKRVT